MIKPTSAARFFPQARRACKFLLQSVCKFMCFSLLLLVAIPSIAQQRIEGRVYQQSSGWTAVEGVFITEADSNGDYSKADGSFSLSFNSKGTGETVYPKIGLNGNNLATDKNGKVWELVNNRELEHVEIPSTPTKSNELKIIVAEQGTRDAVAMEYFGILKSSTNKRVGDLEKELSRRKKDLGKAHILVAELENKLESYKILNDSIKLFREAYRIASINRDGQSPRVLAYLDDLKRGYSVEEARENLDAEAAYKEGNSGLNTLEASISELETVVNSHIGDANFVEAFENQLLIVDLIDHKLLDKKLLFDALSIAQGITVFISEYDKDKTGRSYGALGLELGQRASKLFNTSDKDYQDYLITSNLITALLKMKEKDYKESEELILHSKSLVQKSLNADILPVEKKDSLRLNLKGLNAMLGAIYRDQGKYPSTDPLMRPLLQSWLESNTKDFEHYILNFILKYYNAIASSYESMFAFDRAENDYKATIELISQDLYRADNLILDRNLEVKMNQAGSTREQILTDYLVNAHMSLGGFYYRTSRPDEAKTHYDRAIDFQKKTLDEMQGVSIFNTIDLLDGMLEVVLSQNDVVFSQQLIATKIELLEKWYNINSDIDLGDLFYEYIELANFLWKTEQIDKADIIFQKVVNEYIYPMPDEIPARDEIFSYLKAIEFSSAFYMEQGQWDLAFQLTTDYLKSCQAFYMNDTNSYAYKVQKMLFEGILPILINQEQVTIAAPWFKTIDTYFDAQSTDVNLFKSQISLKEQQISFYREAGLLNEFSQSEIKLLELQRNKIKELPSSSWLYTGLTFLIAENQKLGQFDRAYDYNKLKEAELIRLKPYITKDQFLREYLDILSTSSMNEFYRYAQTEDASYLDKVKANINVLRMTATELPSKNEYKPQFIQKAEELNENLNSIPLVLENNDIFFLIDALNEDIDSYSDHPARQVQLSEQVVRYYQPFLSLSNSEINRQLATTYGNKAWYELNAKQFEAAYESAKKGLALDSTQTWIHTNLALALQLTDREDEALVIYQKFMNTDYDESQKFSEVFLQDITDLNKAGIYDSSLNSVKSTLQASIDLEKKEDMVSKFIGYANEVRSTEPLMAINYYREAKRLFTEVNGLNDQVHRFDNIIAYCYFLAKEYQASIDQYRKNEQIAVDTDDFNSWGMSHYNLGNYHRALELYDRAKSASEGDKYQYLYLNNSAMALLKNGDLSKAQSRLKQLDREFPNDSRVLRNWGVYYALKGKKEKALEYLEKAIAAGYEGAEWLKVDTSVNSLREELRFKNLILFLENKELAGDRSK